jgi:uncharacterized protein YndB with AHSA1/START domain
MGFMQVIKAIAIVLALLVAGVLVFAATKPDTFRVERSMSIKAPPEKIFPYINDLHGWQAWSPYEHKDPAMKRAHSGAPAGKGAVYAWDGNREVGQGSIEITEATAPSNVRMKLDFVRPFEATNVVDFTLRPEGDATKVTWAMNGPANFISKVMQVFMNMDRMVGTDFEAGLAKLKSIAEK